MRRTPTEKQYAKLRILASGAAGVAWRKRDTEPLVRRGWVEADLDGTYYNWVRITPDGIRALAVAVEKYGLPDLGPSPTSQVRVCSDCGSGRWHVEEREVARA